MTIENHDTDTKREPTTADLPVVTGEEHDLGADVVYALTQRVREHECETRRCNQWATHYIYGRNPHLSTWRCPRHLRRSEPE